MSWRHDSILGVMEKWIKAGKEKNKGIVQGGVAKKNQRSEDTFVKEGTKVPKKKQQQESWWGARKDQVILVDYRSIGGNNTNCLHK